MEPQELAVYAPVSLALNSGRTAIHVVSIFIWIAGINQADALHKVAEIV